MTLFEKERRAAIVGDVRDALRPYVGAENTRQTRAELKDVLAGLFRVYQARYQPVKGNC